MALDRAGLGVVWITSVGREVIRVGHAFIAAVRQVRCGRRVWSLAINLTLVPRGESRDIALASQISDCDRVALA